MDCGNVFRHFIGRPPRLKVIPYLVEAVCHLQLRANRVASHSNPSGRIDLEEEAAAVGIDQLCVRLAMFQAHVLSNTVHTKARDIQPFTTDDARVVSS